MFGKREGRGDVSASLLSALSPGALPTRQMKINGVTGLALVDSGCSRSIVHVSFCPGWSKRHISVRTVSGESYRCDGTGPARVSLGESVSVDLNALVVREKPLGFDLVLGMDGIEALGGVTLMSPCDVQFGSEVRCAVASQVAPEEDEVDRGVGFNEEQKMTDVDEADFRAFYNEQDRIWTMTWKWAAGTTPEAIKGNIAEYRIPPECREEYEEELSQWVEKGWLKPYDEKRHGPPKGTIPLMAVLNRNKDKVRPVLDFRQLNSYLDAHTANADVCAEKLREWRRRGTAAALIDLRKAYLQIHVDESLWPYQTVVFHGRRYSLTRLGFGLNVAPLVLKKCWPLF